MKKIEVSPRQLEILQHALGCDQYGRGTHYRNRFVTGPESDDFSDCRVLCDLSLMEDYGPQKMMGGMHYFQVTDLGNAVIDRQSPHPPNISRGRRRYLDFLSADSGMTFIEWLKRRHV